MSLSFIIQPAAEWDIDDIYNRYESINIGLGDIFLAALEQRFDDICFTQEGFALVDDLVRRAPVNKFPYGIFYLADKSLTPNTLHILGVFHHRQRPSLWQHRFHEWLDS